jgi:hypothetical protein
MAIQNDFTIYPASKVIRHTSGTTVYSAVAFYSWLMDTFDEPGYLTYETPIRFNTPTSFTMINGWFLDNGDGSNILQYLNGGGIDTSGYATVSDPVYMLDLDAVSADFIAGDKDKDIEDDGAANDVGPLLAYLNDYPANGSARIWVRDTNSNGEIGDGSAITVESGTGAGTANGASVSGDEIYLNLFTIASFPTDVEPQVYIYQDHPQTGVRTRIAEWSAFTNWDRGTIDVLFPIKLGGTLIDGGSFTTFVRQSGDSYTFVESTITAAGRTPIATETSADEVNITEGEHYLLYDASNTGSFTADDVISDVDLSAGVPPTWYAEVVSVTEFTDTATGLLELRGLRGTITDNDAIYVSNVQEALANGTPGDTLVTYSGGTDPTTLGQVMTGSSSGAKRLLRGIDATENYAVMQDDPTGVTGTNRDAYYIDFTTSDTVTGATDGSFTPSATSTTLISGFNDITVAHMNGTVTVSGIAGGPIILGERLTYNAGAQSAILIYADSLTSPTSLMLGNVDTDNEPDAADTFAFQLSGATVDCDSGLTDDNTQNFEFTLQSEGALYSVFIEGGSIYNAGRSLSDIYAYLQYYVRDGQSITERIIYTSTGSAITEVAAEEYIKAVAAYSATKVAPFGTLAGSTFFGAQGVWLQGMRTEDNNNIKFTDHAGVLQEPDPSINLTISNTRVGDRIAVYLEDGSTTLPDKAQYVSHATLNAQSDSTFDRVAGGGAFPIDTPSSGTFIAVATDEEEEHRYRYDSYNATGGGGTDGQLVLPGELAGLTADGSTSGQTVQDSSEDFTSGGTSAVQIGDIIRNTTDGTWCYVTDITNAATGILVTTLFNDGSSWALTDGFEIHSLVQTYDASDTFFIPYMDFRETVGTDGSPGSQTVTVLYLTNREVVIEARNVESSTQIIPFKTTGTISSTGLSQSVIRNEDTVYT